MGWPYLLYWKNVFPAEPAKSFARKKPLRCTGAAPRLTQTCVLRAGFAFASAIPVQFVRSKEFSHLQIG